MTDLMQPFFDLSYALAVYVVAFCIVYVMAAVVAHVHECWRRG